MVVIDSPHIAEAWGSTVAAPIFRNIALEAVHYYGLAPRKAISVDTPKVIVIRKQGASRSHHQGGTSAHSVVPSSGKTMGQPAGSNANATGGNATQPVAVGNGGNTSVPPNNSNNTTSSEGNASSPSPIPESSVIVTPTPATNPTNPPTPAGSNN
jgi:hypothetical protein